MSTPTPTRTLADEPQWGERSKMRYLNKDVQRVDGPLKASGRAQYTHDVRLPNMLWARFLLCPHPSASVELDLAPALASAGVVDAMALELSDDKTLFLGQPVAVVAAESPEAAEDGVRAIAASFSEEGWVVDFDQATAEGAPAVRDSGNLREGRLRESGDLDAEMEGAAFTWEAEFEMPVQHHSCLETHGHVVDYRPEDATATVYGSTQVTFALTESADHLELPGEAVEGVVQHMGGGFGAKFSMGVEGMIACQLAKRTGRPVHFMLAREHEFQMAGNRSGNRARFKAAVSADGVLAAVDAEVWRMGGLSGGSYARLPYIYSSRSSRVTTNSVYTNTDGSRAFRAPGHPQASFPMEAAMDELAYGIGMDLLEFRILNLEDEVWHRQLERAAEEIGWAEHPNRTAPGSPDGEYAEGIGFGVSTWGGGGRPSCSVEVKLGRDGSCAVEVGTQDLGTGTRTYVATIVAEEFGLPLEQVHPRIGRTTYGRANGSGGSVTTACLSPAVKDAAHNARVAFIAHLAPLMGIAPEQLVCGEGAFWDAEAPERRMDWGAACASLPATGLSANGEWKEHLQSSGVHGAQAARIGVDLWTGRIKVLDMVVVQDIGLPLNRLAVRSQLNGGMIQALSYGLFEERVIDPWLGVQLNANFEDYKVAGPREMPNLRAIIDEDDIGRGPIGVGEPPIIPGHSAIANALRNACGVRLTKMPLTPDKVLMELERMRSEGDQR